MFNKASKDWVSYLEERIEKLENKKSTHAVCAHCGITGHIVDMQPFTQWSIGGSYTQHFHNGCYAERFKKHLCPNKCGKWLDNKGKKK